eukprot:95083_1
MSAMSAFNLAAEQPPTRGARAIVPALGVVYIGDTRDCDERHGESIPMSEVAKKYFMNEPSYMNRWAEFCTLVCECLSVNANYTELRNELNDIYNHAPAIKRFQDHGSDTEKASSNQIAEYLKKLCEMEPVIVCDINRPYPGVWNGNVTEDGKHIMIGDVTEDGKHINGDSTPDGRPREGTIKMDAPEKVPKMRKR